MFNFNYRPALLWKYFSIVSVAKLVYVFIAPGIEEPDIGLNEVFTPELRYSSDYYKYYCAIFVCDFGPVREVSTVMYGVMLYIIL